MSRVTLGLGLIAVLPLALLAQQSSSRSAVNGRWDRPGTFSILAYDPETGEIGGAVQSRVFSVGNGVLWAEAGVGAVATQAIVDVSYGPQGLELLRQGMAPKDIVKTIWERDPDPRPARGDAPNQANWTKYGRQFAVINARGDVAAYTGPRAPEWAGDRQSQYVTAQGNTLAGDRVVPEMVRAFEASGKDASGNRNHISFRLMAALEAGQAAGGDNRGMQSAAMIVVKKDCGVWLHNDVVLRLQVDDMPVTPQQLLANPAVPTPLTELRRLVQQAARQRGGNRGCF